MPAHVRLLRTHATHGLSFMGTHFCCMSCWRLKRLPPSLAGIHRSRVWAEAKGMRSKLLDPSYLEVVTSRHLIFAPASTEVAGCWPAMVKHFPAEVACRLWQACSAADCTCNGWMENFIVMQTLNGMWSWAGREGICHPWQATRMNAWNSVHRQHDILSRHAIVLPMVGTWQAPA